MKEHWPNAVLILCGVGAVSVLLFTLFRPTQAAWDPAICYYGEQEDLKCIRKLGPAAVPILLKKARAQAAFRSDLVAELAGLGPPALPGLVSAFEDCDPRVRLTAVRAFVSLKGNIEPQAALAGPALVRLLSDMNGEIRYTAALAWRRMGLARVQAIPGLMDALAGDRLDSSGDSHCIRLIATQLLGKIGPDASAAVPKLTRMLHDPSSDLGKEALIALWRITLDMPRIEPELSMMLTDPDPATRDAAIVALDRIGREAKLDPCLIAEAAMARDQSVLDLAASAELSAVEP